MVAWVKVCDGVVCWLQMEPVGDHRRSSHFKMNLGLDHGTVPLAPRIRTCWSRWRRHQHRCSLLSLNLCPEPPVRSPSQPDWSSIRHQGERFNAYCGRRTTASLIAGSWAWGEKSLRRGRGLTGRLLSRGKPYLEAIVNVWASLTSTGLTTRRHQRRDTPLPGFATSRAGWGRALPY